MYRGNLGNSQIRQGQFFSKTVGRTIIETECFFHLSGIFVDFQRNLTKFRCGKMKIRRGKTKVRRGKTKFRRGKTKVRRGKTKFRRGKTKVRREKMISGTYLIFPYETTTKQNK